MKQATSLSVAPADGAAAVGQTWPDLFIRSGRTLQQVTPEQAGEFMERFFRANIEAGKRTPFVPLCDCTGKQIGHISPNGRAWLGAMNSTHVEIPQAGRKTAAQQKAEGWKDCKAV